MRTLLLLLLTLTLTAHGDSIEGEITFKEADPGFVRTFGDKVKATTNWRLSDFVGDEAIFAEVTLTNTASISIGCHYYVAFFDADRKLIGAVRQSKGPFRTGTQVKLGGAMIPLPRGAYKRIRFYQAVIYDDEDNPVPTKAPAAPSVR